MKTQTISYDSRSHIFWTCVFALVASMGLYVYAVNATVRNTVARENLEAEVANLSTHIGEMEFKFISLKNKVTLDLAMERGFKEVSNPLYVARAQSGLLTLNTIK